MTKKSIIISQKAHSELAKISKTFNCSYGSLVESMIIYFKRTGIDPNNAVNENPSVMVKALDKRIVSFLKVQERDILKPLRSEVYVYHKKQIGEFSKIIDNYDKTIAELNNRESKRDAFITLEIKKQRSAIIEIQKYLDEHNKSGIHNKIKKIFE